MNNIFVFPPLLTGVLILLLGLVTLQRRRKVNYAYFLLCFLTFIWLVSYGLAFSRKENDFVLKILFKIGYGGIIFISTAWFAFVIEFLNKKTWEKFVRITYLISAFFFLLLLFTNSFITGFKRYFWGYYPLALGSIWHPIFVCFYSTLWTISTILLFISMRRSTDPLERMRIKYIFLSLVIVLPGVLDFAPNYGVAIYPFAWFLVTLCISVVYYSILKYRLMDIRVFISRTTAFLVSYPFLLSIPFFFAYRMYPILYPPLGLNWWLVPSGLLVFFATLSPLAYDQIKRRMEDRFLSEERHAHQLLTQASSGMMRIRSIKRLLGLIVHIITKTLKLENASAFLLDEVSNSYKLYTVRLKSTYQYLESMPVDDPLIEKLSNTDTPLVLEELRQEIQELKPEINGDLPEIISQMKAIGAAVIIPAISRGVLLGFLVLGEKRSKRMYTSEDLNVLWVLSNQAALAIENARFHQKAQEELLREDREMTARFIGHGASHQFGNLLNRIIQRSAGRDMDLEDIDLDTLSTDELKKIILAHKEEFSAITKITTQGKDIVSGILSIGSGSPVDFKQEDLKTIITKAIETVKLKQSKEAVQKLAPITEIVTNIPDNLPKIWCNSLQIEQVLDNLLDNDLEAIEEKDILIKRGELIAEGTFRGKIIINAEYKDSRIFLGITDNGIGIKPENLRKMFIPFFTTKATERLSRKGHGIGMHVVESIIKVHQGKIYVASTEYGKGTTFMVEFPIKITENKKL